MLHERFPVDRLRDLLIPREQFKPFPDAADRAFWDGLPDEVRASLLVAGESQLDQTWPILPATKFLEYVRNGNRTRFQEIQNHRRRGLTSLILAECVEGRGRFVDPLVDVLWATLEETWWGVPAHVNRQKAGATLPDSADPTVDLFAAETGHVLAWAGYLLPEALDSVSPVIMPRIHRDLAAKILQPCMVTDYNWMGLGGQRVNNWNPWICSNWLVINLLSEHDAARRVAAVDRILLVLDRFIDAYHDDGGCDEGPGYWYRAAGSLFDCLDLLHRATAGAVDLFGEPLIANMGRYPHRAHIADAWVTNFADAPARTGRGGALIYRYGKAIEDEPTTQYGAWLMAQGKVPVSGSEGLGRTLMALTMAEELCDPALSDAQPPLVRDVWLDGIQVAVSRDQAGSTDGLYLAAKGGHNHESHNHNDIGHFIVYKDGQPVLVDAGVEAYTARTFSPQRYEIWTMQSGYHNLPTINGWDQAPGKEFAARDVTHEADDRGSIFAQDIAGAWPEQAGVKSWRRTIRHERGKAITVEDAWELDRAESLALSLLFVARPDVTSPGVIRVAGVAFNPEASLASSPAEVTYDGNAWTAQAERIEITDEQLSRTWGPELWRVVLSAKAPATTGASRVCIV